MALKLYYKNSLDEYVAVSLTTGEPTVPVRTSHDGKTGDVQSVLLYLQNDDDTKWYSNIFVEPYDLIDRNPYGDIAYSETGWGVKLSSGGLEPTTHQWEAIRWGEAIEIEDIGSDSDGDIINYYPFWYYVTCPPNTNAQNKTDITLKVLYTENAVS